MVTKNFFFAWELKHAIHVVESIYLEILNGGKYYCVRELESVARGRDCEQYVCRNVI